MSRQIGLVDGSTPSNTRRFHVVLDDDAVAQLDDLVMSTQVLPDGTELHHYGIVVEGLGQIEGAELPSDTQRIAGARTMPGRTTRRVEVQTLRTVPELWIPPAPGRRGRARRGRASRRVRCSSIRWSSRSRSASTRTVRR